MANLSMLLRLSGITACYALGGLAFGCVLSGFLLPLYLSRRLQTVGAVVAIGLKSTPAFVFPLALGGVVGGVGWGGVGLKMIVSGLICFFPILAGAGDGRLRVPAGLRRTCDAYGATRIRRLWNAEFGWVVAGLVAGIKSAVPLAVVGAIVAEYVSGTESKFSGLGARFSVHRSTPSELWLDILAATVLGCLMFWLVMLVERWMERRLLLAA